MSKTDLALTVKKTTDETFFVGSETDPRVGYTVNIKEGTCECPQYQHRGLYCKHQEVVDEWLIAKEIIKLDWCEAESEYDLTCAWQQVMIDRGYILFNDHRDIHVWKKKEAWDKLADDKKGDIQLEGSPDRQFVHRTCRHFHLFDRSPKLKGDQVVSFRVMGISEELANEIFDDLHKIFDKYGNRHIEICEQMELSKAGVEHYDAVEKYRLRMEDGKN